MKLGEYIHALLLEHETVIIPGFGAFVSVDKPAVIQGELIIPPAKTISFTQQLRNNDGILVGYISVRERLSHHQAVKKLEKYSENLLFRLEKGERVVLEKTGTLWFDSNHVLQFEPSPDENWLLDSYGLETISTRRDEAKGLADDVNKNPAAAPEARGQQKVESGETENDQSAAVASGAASNTPEKVAEPVSEQALKTETSQSKSQSPTKETAQNERKKRSAWWFLLILIPIALAGAFLWVKEQKPLPPEKADTAINPIEEKQPLPAEPDVLAEDALDNKMNRAEATAEIVADSMETTVTKAEAEQPTDALKFHLVGGSFKAEENAREFVTVLKNDGLDAFLLGKRGNFYLVVLGTYASELEAVRARNAITEKDTAKNLWVLEE